MVKTDELSKVLWCHKCHAETNLVFKFLQIFCPFFDMVFHFVYLEKLVLLETIAFYYILLFKLNFVCVAIYLNSVWLVWKQALKHISYNNVNSDYLERSYTFWVGSTFLWSTQIIKQFLLRMQWSNTHIDNKMFFSRSSDKMSISLVNKAVSILYKCFNSPLN